MLEVVAVRVCIVLFLLSLYPAVWADITASRYSQARACTLRPELEDVCQVKSILGKNSSYNSYNGMLMYFGESNCQIVIQKCKHNTCYSFRDLTAQLPTDPSIAFTTGFFKSIQIISGATNFALTREGFAFQATSTNVILNYTTQTCDEFYQSHGGVPQQLCNQPIEAISDIDTDAPISLSCSSASTLHTGL